MYRDSILTQLKMVKRSMTALKLCFLALAVLILSNLNAQQLPLFTQYREHSSAINPAAISSDYMVFELNGAIGLSYRSQWTELANAPRTGMLHGHYLFDDFSGVNILVGGHLMSDRTGPVSTTAAYGRIAGVISDDPRFGGLSIGLTAGAVQYGINAAELRLRDVDDITLAQDFNEIYPDVGVGLFAYKMLDGLNFDEDFVYLGISVPQVLGTDFTITDDESKEFSSRRVQHFYAQAGMIKNFWDDSFIEPSVWVKYTENAPINVDVNVRYQFALGIWTGVGVSTARACHLEAGVLLGDNIGYENNLKIGYGFDYFFNDAGATFGSTHELNVGYYFAR